IELKFGTTATTDGLASTDNDSSTADISQDGYASGELNGIRIDQSGTLVGSFTNGRSLGLAQVGVAKFANNEGLASEGGNLFSRTANSGDPIIGAAQTAGRGKISASSLEMSNVDLSRSLTQLIVVQRGFQANSKTITTSDEMLNTLLQLK
ncbi:flagellar hook-basal body complex protein, partial [uncultured Campylobacter sp.]|uniref:flagellar hook-basal body complex protein n=1 Tax=uncultured Campylobacter sp. TaxID=218934 RepID=UPI0026280F70